VLDLERLDERYIVVGAEGQPAHGEVEDLRELEGDFGDGVYPLWSDELQSIVAWAFEKSRFEQDDAEQWVRDAMEPKGANVMDIVRIVATAIGDSFARAFGVADREGVSAESFEETRRKIEDALYERYQDPRPAEISPWIIEIGPDRAIVAVEDKYYAVPYTITDDGVDLGEGEEVERAWVNEQDAPVTLMALTSKLMDGTEAEPDEDDGLVWKELIHPGQWHKMDSGRVVEVTKDIIQSAFEAFTAGLPKYVSVPAGSFHPEQVAAEDNRGFVAKLKMIGDRLFGGFKFTNPETRKAVEEGSIADCSVYLEPEVVHPESGEMFPWALTHVLLTNAPLVQDLEPFGAPIPASASGNVTVDVYVQTEIEEDHMSEQENTDITLSAEDQSLLDNAKELGLTAEDIQAMVEERARVQEQGRDLEVVRIVRALEAKGEHDLVVQQEGTRHWPVVIEAAERVLREQPQALGMSVTDGRTELDETVLSIVNAIPADARMQVAEQPVGSKQHEDPTLDDEDSEEAKAAKAAALAEQLTPRKGAGVGIG